MEDIALNRARAEEIASRASSQKSRSMDIHANGTVNDPEEEEEEETLEVNRKQPANNHIRGICGWEKESVARARFVKGKEPGRVCNRTRKLTIRGGRRRICDRELQKSGKEPCRGKSRPGKQKLANVGPKNAGESRKSGRKTFQTGDYVARGRK